MTISNTEKIDIITDKINQLSIHINILKQCLVDDPSGDVPEKPKRVDVLNDYISKRTALEDIKQSLTNLN